MNLPAAAVPNAVAPIFARSYMLQVDGELWFLKMEDSLHPLLRAKTNRLDKYYVDLVNHLLISIGSSLWKWRDGCYGDESCQTWATSHDGIQ